MRHRARKLTSRGTAPLLLAMAIALTIGGGQTPADTPTSGPLVEPTTGPPIDPEPGDETGPLHPFDPPSQDDRDLLLEQLPEPDQAYIIAQGDSDQWVPIHVGYSEATHEAMNRAEAESAANALGIAGHAELGIVE